MTEKTRQQEIDAVLQSNNELKYLFDDLAKLHNKSKSEYQKAVIVELIGVVHEKMSNTLNQYFNMIHTTTNE